jgi:pimeloyl-ACP methyl ester carboxylesterase
MLAAVPADEGRKPRGEFVEVDRVRVFCRRLEGEGPVTVLVHGNPTSSRQWLPLMRRLRGPAVALDLPGWGSSERPADYDYGFRGHARFFGRFLDSLGIERYRLCVHDWGGLALIEAQRRPEGLERLVLIDTVPLLPGYRWHWVARWFWRRPVLGELFNATLTRAGFALGLRAARGDRRPMPDWFVDMIWQGMDPGTKRAILALYRSADPEELAAAGANLERIDSPTLVVWGTRDPYLPPRFGRLYAERLPRAELFEVEGAGHWPWIERPQTIERLVSFIEPG